MKNLKNILDYYALVKNCDEDLFNYPDPLQVAKKFREPNIALICALFAYGNAKMIVKFLNSLNFELLNKSDEEIKKFYNSYKYRFQNSSDIAQIFITIKRLKESESIENLVKSGLEKQGSMEFGIRNLIEYIYSLNSYKSQGYNFFFGKSFDKKISSPYKRYNMYLRWMVRDKEIDLGLFKGIKKSSLLMPLDIHTQRVSLALGLLKRKSYDFGAVLELTSTLRNFDKDDPIKYDFALYRIGQQSELDRVLAKI